MSSYLIGRYGSAAFNPITGLTWAHVYSAEGPNFVALGIADGAAVTTWPDEVGSNNPTQPTSGKRPLYRASGTGLSLPCLDFDGSDDNFGTFDYSFPLAQPNSIVVLGYIDTTVNQYIVEGTAPGRRIIGIDGTPKFGHYAGAWALTTGSTSAGVFAFRSKLVNGTSDVLTLNGSTISTATSGDQTTSGLTIGSAFGGSSTFFNGRLHSIWIYDGDVTASGGWSAPHPADKPEHQPERPGDECGGEELGPTPMTVTRTTRRHPRYDIHHPVATLMELQAARFGDGTHPGDHAADATSARSPATPRHQSATTARGFGRG